MNRRDTIRLAMLPTPFEQMPRLSLALGRDGQIPSIWIKRDDCTGFAGGGNKARKLEYLVADALNHGADVLVTVGRFNPITLARPQLRPRATGLGACCF
jgi:1-aminocyclopropane-1-carboxylate deaminase/D-cysteine desulfhydrase-like pyridoxal-dependent ACC family enzyme